MFCSTKLHSYVIAYYPAAPPGTPSTPLSFIVKFVLYLSCEKNENKQKEAGLGPFNKLHSFLLLAALWLSPCRRRQCNQKKIAKCL